MLLVDHLVLVAHIYLRFLREMLFLKQLCPSVCSYQTLPKIPEPALYATGIDRPPSLSSPYIDDFKEKRCPYISDIMMQNDIFPNKWQC